MIAAAFIALYVRAAPMLSPIDELQHLDYMVKASQGELVRLGDHVGELSMREEACRGTDLPGATLPPCNDSDLRPEEFPGGGLNTASGHPPTYYFLTGVVARVLNSLPGIDSILTAGRLVGWLWLSVAILIMWRIFSLLDVSVTSKLVSVSLMVASPAILDSATKVNPDAAALALGAAVLFSFVLWDQERVRNWVPILVSTMSVIFKLTNILGVGLGIAYVLLRKRRVWSDSPLIEGKRSKVEPLAKLTLMAAALPLAIAISWVVLQASLAQIDPATVPMNRDAQIEALTPSHVISQLGQLMTPVQSAYLPPFFRTTGVQAILSVTNWLLIGAALSSFTLAAKKSHLEAIGTSSLGLMLIGGPALVVFNFIFAKIFIMIPPRYGLALVPASFVALGLLMEDRKHVVIVVGIIAAASCLYILLNLVSAQT